MANGDAKLNSLKVLSDPTDPRDVAPKTYVDTAIATAKGLVGTSCTQSGTDSNAGGSNTTATGFASLAEGVGTLAAGDVSHAEGFQSIASGYAAHVEGFQSGASGAVSHAEGYGCTAKTQGSHAQGTNAFISSNGTGWHAEANGMFSVPGDAQAIRMVMREQTTDGSAHQMGNPDQWWWGPDSNLETAYAVTLTVFAKEQTGGAGGRAMWKRMFVVDTNTTNLYGEATIGVDIAHNASGWDINLVNPTNSGNLQINVTGAASTNINWVALIEAIQISG